MNSEIKQKILEAGRIAKEVREWIKPQIKKEMFLIEIAEKIEGKIEELGGKPAFPTNLSINEVAAHYTPSYNDETKAQGILKVDFGVHVDGWIADNAFSIDLEDNEENKNLIESSQEALDNVLKNLKANMEVGKIGKIIQETIELGGFSPVINLSGHSMDQYDLHSGVTIPNVEVLGDLNLETGLYAIEPFATSGNGRVRDGKPSGIYELIDEKNVRSPIARKILDFIKEEYSTLPFCSRWIVKKFGTSALIGLRQLENNGNLHSFSQLIETSGKKVAQAEHTILVDENEIIVTTK